MYYVYLLQGRGGFLYVGSTSDLRRRFSEHNNREELSTKYYAPFRLIYYEAYCDKKDALIRERSLKHHSSAIGHLKRRIKNILK